MDAILFAIQSTSTSASVGFSATKAQFIFETEVKFQAIINAGV